MEWISVKDRLPEPEKGSIYSRGVLAIHEDDLVVFYATYVEMGKCWLDYHVAPNGKIDPISHWMEIPKFSM